MEFSNVELLGKHYDAIEENLTFEERELAYQMRTEELELEIDRLRRQLDEDHNFAH